MTLGNDGVSVDFQEARQQVAPSDDLRLAVLVSEELCGPRY